MERKRVSTGEKHLEVVDAGEGPVLVFVHGFPLDHSVWHYQICEFARDYRVICPDLAGYGSSPAKSGHWSLSDVATDLAIMLDELKVDQPVCFCGLSMGGYVGWEFWRQFPTRLSQLVACDTRAANDSAQVQRARRVSANRVMSTGTAKVAEEMLPRLFCESNLSSELAKRICDTIARTSPDSFSKGQLAMSKREDATSWLPEIEVPTLFIVGEFDEITSPDEMQSNAELVPNSTFAQIANAGHLAPLENHVDFNRAMRLFLATGSK